MASLYLLFVIALTLIPLSLSQTPPAPAEAPPSPAEAPAPSSDSCNGVFLSYTHTRTIQLPPDLLKTDPNRQPYRFQSTLTVLNNGLDELKSWRAFVGFHHDEILVSSDGSVLVAGENLPAEIGNGTVFAGFPTTDLKTAIQTAGDLTQMQVQVKLVGVQFGVAPPAVPMPVNISLANDGFDCPKASLLGKNHMEVCCTVDPNFKSNITVDEDFLPRQSGDLTIMYDVLRTYDSNYWAEVKIANHNPLGRLDYWQLSWDWMNGEFINNMIGAYPSVVDSSECIFGAQGQHYTSLDFANVLNCERRPTLIDLPLAKYNDTKLGYKPYCCRNGTILPPQMDEEKSVSAFQVEVYKMPPDLNRSELSPPQNWKINGIKLNPDYECGAPVRVSPSASPDASGLPLNSTAVASWQVVCNITQPAEAKPKCCVSFSAFYNESVVPCRTCACGCGASDRTCSATSAAMLLPAEAILVPFANRTAKALAWAQLHHLPSPNPMPCADNCGVSLNWHVLSDYTKGWTARVTVFNWDETNFADWFAAAQLNKAAPGFEKMYSFNGTALEIDGVNSTLFMQGLPGLNYIVAESDGADPLKDPRVPGKQQSVISFTKKHTPGIDVPLGDGFPTKVFFNGEECLLPLVLPSSGAPARIFAGVSSALLIAAVLFL